MQNITIKNFYKKEEFRILNLYPTHELRKFHLTGMKIYQFGEPYESTYGKPGVIKEFIDDPRVDYCYIETYDNNGRPTRQACNFHKIYAAPNTIKDFQFIISKFEEFINLLKERITWMEGTNIESYDEADFIVENLLSELSDETVNIAKGREIVKKYLGGDLTMS